METKRKQGAQPLPPPVRAEICAAYESGLSLRQTMTATGRSQNAIRNALREAGVVSRPTGTHRRFHCKDAFFETIDAEPKAYWLGFLAADGCVSDTKRTISLALQARDEQHVIAFREAIGGTGRVTVSQILHGFGTGKSSARFSVVSQQMVNDLTRHGVTPRKTATLRWPNLPPDMYRHFLRGYFDGDGCFSTMGRGEKAMTWGIVGTEPFLLECQAFLIESLGLSQVKLTHHWETRFIRYLNYGGTAQVCLIADLMYAGATIWLERKRALIRGVKPERGRYGMAECGRGHAYTPENTIRRKNGGRLCKICDHKRRADYIAKDPERWKAYHRVYAARWHAERRAALRRDESNTENTLGQSVR